MTVRVKTVNTVTRFVKFGRLYSDQFLETTELSFNVGRWIALSITTYRTVYYLIL